MHGHAADRRPTRPSTASQPSFEDLGTPLIATTFVVLDLETTGLRPTADRITEIGAVKVQGGEVLGELRTFVRPERPIPAAVTAVTGITDAMVRDAPAIDQVLPALRAFLAEAVFVAHNAAFDLGFLRAAFAAHGGTTYEPVVIDTARLSRRLLRDEVHNVRLATVATHLHSRVQPDHRALQDARATVDVLHGLIERAGSLGATTVEDLRDLARSSSDRRFRRISLVRDAPSTCGVYRFLDARDEILYVGKATDLHSRLRTYFGQDRRRRTDDLVRETARVTWTATPTLLEAEVREIREIHQHLPRYNRRSKHPPAPAYIAVTREPFPRLSIVAAPRTTHRAVLGPLASRRTAETVVAALQDWTAIRTCTDRLRRAQDHPACLQKDLGRCGAPCDGSESRDDHLVRVERIESTFADPTALLDDLRARMLAAAGAGRFERAGELRSQLHTTARGLRAGRRIDALVAVDELVLARTLTSGTEVVVVRRGRLAGSLRLDAMRDPISEAAIRDRLALTPLDENVHASCARSREEIELVLAWSERPDVRIVAAEPGYAEPLPGGQVLAQATSEARRVARATRRDSQTLAGAKVRRRGTDERSSAP